MKLNNNCVYRIGCRIYRIWIKLTSYVFCMIMSIIKKFFDSEKYFYKLGIVVIVKNEADYIEEWIEYHKFIGVEKFYIYDNGSNDKTKIKLNKYIDEGLVEYIYYPGIAKQLNAYNHAIRHFKNECKYMAFIDADEFLVLMDKEKTIFQTIEEIIESGGKGASGVAVNWRMFGSSGFEKKPSGGVLENFLYRADAYGKGNSCIKTIANPRKVYKYQHVHFPTYFFGNYSVNENGERVLGSQNKCDEPQKIRINHYFTKSKEEWIKRRSLGKADTRVLTNIRSLEEFYEHDNNEIYDDYILYYVNKIRIKSDF